MAINGQIQCLYKDRSQTEAIFPITKVRAITDDNGVGLNVLLENLNSGSSLDIGTLQLITTSEIDQICGTSVEVLEVYDGTVTVV